MDIIGRSYMLITSGRLKGLRLLLPTGAGRGFQRGVKLHGFHQLSMNILNANKVVYGSE